MDGVKRLDYLARWHDGETGRDMRGPTSGDVVRVVNVEKSDVVKDVDVLKDMDVVARRVRDLDVSSWVDLADFRVSSWSVSTSSSPR